MSKKDTSVLVVDDEETFRYLLSSLIGTAGYAVDTAADGVAAINAVQTKLYHVVLLDIRMPKVDGIEVLKFIKNNHPGIEVIMLTGTSDVKTAVECMRLGAYNFITKPTTADELLTTIGRAIERRQLMIDNFLMKDQLDRLQGTQEMVGKSEAFQKVLEIAAKVAPTESTVLIQGNSGTGKELIANFIFKNSLRANAPFVTLNCASIPDTLIESELFGHEKGAFTGAHVQRVGRIEMASGGTLFLDEPGDLPLELQAKLLRFLQERVVERIGGRKEIPVDVRIVCATHQNLEQQMKDGRFREDLYYRVSEMTIQIPALKDRTGDATVLAEALVWQNERMGVGVWYLALLRDRLAATPTAVVDNTEILLGLYIMTRVILTALIPAST